MEEFETKAIETGQAPQDCRRGVLMASSSSIRQNTSVLQFTSEYPNTDGLMPFLVHFLSLQDLNTVCLTPSHIEQGLLLKPQLLQKKGGEHIKGALQMCKFSD